jgi:hypothetical protein
MHQLKYRSRMGRRRFLSLSAATAAYAALPLSAQRVAQYTPSSTTTDGGLDFIMSGAASKMAGAVKTFHTRDASVQIDHRGFITSLHSCPRQHFL